MKCLYYLSPNLDSTHSISDDLHDAGVSDFYLHVISRDKAGLKKEHIHSSNWLETRDIVRDGFIGAFLGFLGGLLLAGLFDFFQVFGVEPPGILNIMIVGLVTLFGAWVGGLTGVATKNKKLEKFQDDLDAGKQLILIYALKELDEKIRSLMKTKHPEAQLVATDAHFVNPFSKLNYKRKRYQN
ncbi:MAG: hypothetical protein HKN59_00340 [Gammaproteobacteria bacterium]|nr:hypothetical protein [Gammaproteobacteria bacterium]